MNIFIEKLFLRNIIDVSKQTIYNIGNIQIIWFDPFDQQISFFKKIMVPKSIDY